MGENSPWGLKTLPSKASPCKSIPSIRDIISAFAPHRLGWLRHPEDDSCPNGVRPREDPLGPNPFLGVIFHWIGGFCSATNFIPFRGIKRWSWEVYWIIQGVAAWLIAPTVLAFVFVPHPYAILQQAHLTPGASLFWPMFWGLLWGVGGLTFGLAIRYLGLGLGYAIALGFCTGFGTIIPPIYYGQWHAITHEWSGQVTLLGVLLSLIAIGVSGAAGASKEREVTVLRHRSGRGQAHRRHDAHGPGRRPSAGAVGEPAGADRGPVGRLRHQPGVVTHTDCEEPLLRAVRRRARR